jgi:sialic acid synthase SpsE
VDDIKAGDMLSQKNIRCIRPGYGLPPKYYKKLLDMKAVKDVKRGSPMSWNMVKLLKD